MIRSVKLNLNYANQGKLEVLNGLMNEMTRVINLFIDVLWAIPKHTSDWVDIKVDTELTATFQQCLGKQALDIIKAQRKRKRKTKPVFKGNAFTLDSRIVDFQYDENTFDIWIRLRCMGIRPKIKLPSRKHKHFNKHANWVQKKSIVLSRTKKGAFSATVFFEKKAPSTKKRGKTVGVDVGYKKLLVVSTGKVLDDGLEAVYEKIARKKQGSNAFKRALIERNNLINQSLNKMSFYGVKEVVCEKLKGVKYKSKGKRSKKFNNKLQRWSYSKVLIKLSRLTDEAGVLLTAVNPAYTSQKCSACGVIRKGNRRGETYRCACGNKIDADLNAAINLSHMGVYSPDAKSAFQGRV